jgi:hypothetical protein
MADQSSSAAKKSKKKGGGIEKLFRNLITNKRPKATDEESASQSTQVSVSACGAHDPVSGNDADVELSALSNYIDSISALSTTT